MLSPLPVNVLDVYLSGQSTMAEKSLGVPKWAWLVLNIKYHFDNSTFFKIKIHIIHIIKPAWDSWPPCHGKYSDCS